MSDLVAISFDDEHTAFEMRAELVKLQKEYLIDMEDVVVVTKDDKGKFKLHQAVNLTAAGAVGGSFWGMLIGMIFLNPLLAGAVGAWAGDVWSFSITPRTAFQPIPADGAKFIETADLTLSWTPGFNAKRHSVCRQVKTAPTETSQGCCRLWPEIDRLARPSGGPRRISSVGARS